MHPRLFIYPRNAKSAGQKNLRIGRKIFVNKARLPAEAEGDGNTAAAGAEEIFQLLQSKPFDPPQTGIRKGVRAIKKHDLRALIQNHIARLRLYARIVARKRKPEIPHLFKTAVIIRSITDLTLPQPRDKRFRGSVFRKQNAQGFCQQIIT